MGASADEEQSLVSSAHRAPVAIYLDMHTLKRVRIVPAEFANNL